MRNENKNGFSSFVQFQHLIRFRFTVNLICFFRSFDFARFSLVQFKTSMKNQPKQQVQLRFGFVHKSWVVCCCCFALFIRGGAFCKSKYMVFVVCSGMCSKFHVLVSIVPLSKPLNPITIGRKSKCASSVFHFDSFAFAAAAAFVTSSMPFRFTIVSVFVRCCFCVVCAVRVQVNKRDTNASWEQCEVQRQ